MNETLLTGILGVGRTGQGGLIARCMKMRIPGSGFFFFLKEIDATPSYLLAFQKSKIRGFSLFLPALTRNLRFFIDFF